MTTVENSLFITFEGGEGAGKTTLVDGIQKSLQAQGLSVLRTREPGGTPLGEAIRGLLLEQKRGMPIGAEAECLLFLAARAQHLDGVIAPALNQGKIVLCDRFHDSSIAYQGGGRCLGIAHVKNLCDLVCRGVKPTLTFYLDIDPEVGLRRAAQARSADRMEQEKLTFHQRVRDAFLLLAKEDPERICVLDATKTPDELLNEALRKIESFCAKCR